MARCLRGNGVGEVKRMAVEEALCESEEEEEDNPSQNISTCKVLISRTCFFIIALQVRKLRPRRANLLTPNITTWLSSQALEVPS